MTAPWDQPPEQWHAMVITTTGQLALFLGGSADSFTGMLLQLMAKADPGRLAQLEAAFPREAVAYRAWNRFPDPPTFIQLYAALMEHYWPEAWT